MKKPQVQMGYDKDGKPNAPMRIWLNSLRNELNEKASKVDGTVNNIIIINEDGNYEDGGESINDLKKYVAERYITEAELPEAGTHPGRIPPSLAIGLDDTNYIYIDGNGNLYFKGNTELKLEDMFFYLSG